MSAAPSEVVRVWRGAAAPTKVVTYLTHFRDRVEPALGRLPGFRGAEVLTRVVAEAVEIVVQTRWESLAAVQAFAGPDLEVAVVEPAAVALLQHHDDFVRHFAVAYRSA